MISTQRRLKNWVNFSNKKHLHFSDLDDKDTKMVGQVNEVKTHVSDARRNIKDIDSKMGQIDDKVAFVKLELDRLKSDEGSHFKKFLIEFLYIRNLNVVF